MTPATPAGSDGGASVTFDMANKDNTADNDAKSGGGGGANGDNDENAKRKLFASGDLKNALQGLHHNNDNGNESKTDDSKSGGDEKDDKSDKGGPQTVALKTGLPVRGIGKNGKRLSHLPQPSVRRLNILDGLKSGNVHLKHLSNTSKTRHKSTHSKFIFAKVLADIRQLIMPDSDEDDDEDEQTKKEWLA